VTTDQPQSAHDHAILDQFTRQAAKFAARPELHSDDVLALIADAARLRPSDAAIDLACGPGSVACALAARAGKVVGLDSTPAMLEQARALAARQGLTNVEWVESGVYATPYRGGAFDAVTCRFAFHHLQDPPAAFAEMVRLAAPGGRIVLCDGVASDDPEKAKAMNAMERLRDPSTVEFRTLGYLRALFPAAGLPEPALRSFQVGYRAIDLVNASFPAGEGRSALLELIEGSVEDDRLGMNVHQSPEGVRLAYPSVILTAIKPL
jgi:SAM-dependent methyltransferase